MECIFQEGRQLGHMKGHELGVPRKEGPMGVPSKRNGLNCVMAIGVGKPNHIQEFQQ